jgi:hypothetical protein
MSIGDEMRYAFNETLDLAGEDFHVSGQTRRGFYSDHKGEKRISFQPGEFALKAGDIIIRWANEKRYKVVSVDQDVVAGTIVSFYAVVLPA